MRPIVLAATFAIALPGLAFAQTDHSRMDHSMDAPDAAATADAMSGGTDVRPAFEAANARMHADMGAELTGDADIDFARSMIPHHRGAIDMAELVLEHGQDAELQDLAREIIEAQEAEIAQLEEWIAENDPSAMPAQ